MAAQSTSDTPPRLESDLIDGLILNRAMTRVGHRFYREFVAAYRDIGGMTEHGGLSIVELATARSGSKISVLHNRKPIFVTVVSPAGRQLDKLAEQVARRVDSILKQNKKQASWAQWLDPDLAPDEF
nr:curli production assembly/transport protein CsgE [Shewanella aquimarina]